MITKVAIFVAVYIGALAVIVALLADDDTSDETKDVLDVFFALALALLVIAITGGILWII